MKIFGEKASKNSKSGKKTQKQPSVRTPYDRDPSYDVMGRAATGKTLQGKRGKSRKQKSKKKNMILLIVSILAFLFAGGAFLAVQFIKPPELAVHENDKTIIDHENGDVVAIDPGQRISDYFTFLVCATDIDETRTDNMMVVGFDTKQHKVNVLNIPRDVMCANNKSGANRKINAAYGSKKDINNTKKEIKKVIGFTPDKFIVVNFNGIAEIVDAIGGITYDVPFKMIYNDPIQDLHIYFEPGVQKMNGKQVVEFLRWRHNDPGYTRLQKKGYDGGDESRIAKQQEFLKHLATQILKPENILKAKPIAEAVFRNVKTDLTLGELVWMANQAMQVKSTDIQMFTLPGYAANSYAGTNAFLSFFFPNESKTLALINEYFNPYDRKITSLDVIESPPEGKRRPGVQSDEDEEEIVPKEDLEQEDETEQSTEDSDQESERNPDTVPDDTSGSNESDSNGSSSSSENATQNGNSSSGQNGTSNENNSSGENSVPNENNSSGQNGIPDGTGESGSQTPSTQPSLPTEPVDPSFPPQQTDPNAGNGSENTGIQNGSGTDTGTIAPEPVPDFVPPDTTAGSGNTEI